MPDPITGTIAAASVGSAAIGSRAASKASKAQTQAADQAAQLQREQFDRQVELQEPFRQAGMTGQNELMRLLGLQGDAGSAGYGSATKPFGMEQFQADPGYGFRMSEGLKALDRSAAARGGLLSGATLKGATRYGQGVASQEYQNAFDRYQKERLMRLAPLQSLSGMAQTSAANIGSAGDQYSTNVGNNLATMGQARASGYINNANVMREGLEQGASIFAKAYGARPSINDLQEYTPTSRRI
jgi:hypothetical protein